MTLMLCNEVQAGMVLASDVKDRQGGLLIARGVTLTEAHLRALKIRGINSVRIVRSAETLDVVPPSLSEMSRARERTEELFRHNTAYRSHPFVRTLHSQCLLRFANEPRADDVSDLFQADLVVGDGTRDAEATPPSLEYLVQKTNTVASLPAVYHQLLSIVNDERSSAKDIARVISADSGLTARLLRLVNSPFYGFPGKIDTVSRAVAIVGVNELCQLALATTVIHTFTRALQGKIDVRHFWCHSLGCATTCRNLALRRRSPNPEHYFVIGLLHDLGRLVLFMHTPIAAMKTLHQSIGGAEPAYRLETAYWSYNHADVGKSLLQAWGLPASVFEPVGNHHHPTHNQSFLVETSVIHLADIIVKALFHGTFSDLTPAPPFTPAAWDAVALTADIIPEVMQESALQTEELSGVFDMEAEQ